MLLWAARDFLTSRTSNVRLSRRPWFASYSAGCPFFLLVSRRLNFDLRLLTAGSPVAHKSTQDDVYNSCLIPAETMIIANTWYLVPKFRTFPYS
jgi:hypothetical protein